MTERDPFPTLNGFAAIEPAQFPRCDESAPAVKALRRYIRLPGPEAEVGPCPFAHQLQHHFAAHSEALMARADKHHGDVAPIITYVTPAMVIAERLSQGHTYGLGAPVDHNKVRHRVVYLLPDSNNSLRIRFAACGGSCCEPDVDSRCFSIHRDIFLPNARRPHIGLTAPSVRSRRHVRTRPDVRLASRL